MELAITLANNFLALLDAMAIYILVGIIDCWIFKTNSSR